jgi:TPR repeat protein/S1-C subfamily serine protease
MSGNAKFRWFFLAPIAVALLVVASPASAKDDLIADVYFDDGSVLHDAKFTPKDSLESSIKVKHENEFFHLDFKDLKTIEFDVKPINNNIRIKIKTKIGVVINDSFSMPAKHLHHTQRAIGYYLCQPRLFKFKSKVTGKEISHRYEITNLIESKYSSLECRYGKSENKAISAIVFKDDIGEKTGLADYSQSPPTQSKPTIPLAPARDITPPSIDIASFITVKEETPIIRGKVSDGSKVVQVTVEGRQTDLKKNGVFSFKRYVPSGESSIRIVAIDEWGNKSQKDVRIKRIVTAKIPTPKKPQSRTGSGFFVSKMGHVITNAHVVQNCNRVTIGDNTNKQVPAELIKTNRSNDLALLKISTLEMASAESKSLIQKLGITVVPLASKGLLRSEDVKLGEKVLVAGYPFVDMLSDTIKVTSGIVSSTRGPGDNSGQFQLDAAIQPGNSGGPIYDIGGNIVGVVISQLDKRMMEKAIGSLPENVNFGIKASTVRQFLTSSGLPSKKSERTEEKSTEQLAEIAKNQALMVMCLEVAKMSSDLPKKTTTEKNQIYATPMQEAGLAIASGDYQKAYTLLMREAKQGNPLAQGSLGMLHYKGWGIPKDYKEAIKWTRKAAEQGLLLATYDMGVYYDKGHGIPQDYQMAIKWWTKAAEKNHVLAQFNLGLKYAKGQGVPIDPITAYKWANMAATNHFEKAKRLLNILKKQMTDAQITEAQRLSEELIKKIKASKRRLRQSTNVSLKNPAQRTPLPGPLGGDLEQFQTLVRQIPNDPRAHNYLGNAYKSLGRYKEAFASYKEALRIDPNYFTVHRNLGWVYEELGRYQEAIASYKEALRIEPDYASAHFGLGNAYNKLGRYQEAIASYKETLRIKPDHTSAHTGLRNLLNNLEQKTAYGIEKNT